MKKLFVVMLLTVLTGCAGTIEGIRADYNLFLQEAQPVIDEITTAIDLLKEANDNVATNP